MSCKVEREIRKVRRTLDVHSSTLIGIQNTLGQITRVLNKHDRPATAAEAAMNPDLNVQLAGKVPFNDQESVNYFFSSQERIGVSPSNEF